MKPSGICPRCKIATALSDCYAPYRQDLIDLVSRDAMDSELSPGSTWKWHVGGEMVGCGRVIAVIPLTVDTFDDLINGRWGYRAQYYLSAMEGRQFNNALIKSLCRAAKQIYERNQKFPWWEFFDRSVRGPYSKIWVHGDGDPFHEAPQAEFMPWRWAHLADKSIWIRAPRPKHPAIELKGTWLDKHGNSRLDRSKSDRDQTLHERGGV